MEAPAKVKTKSAVREYAEAILMALLLALFIRTFIVQAFKIPSGSMIPTLLIGDHILVNKLAYGVRMPAKSMAKRVSFLIDLDGKIAHVTDSPSADKHLAEMKDAVEKIKKG